MKVQENLKCMNRQKMRMKCKGGVQAVMCGARTATEKYTRKQAVGLKGKFRGPGLRDDINRFFGSKPSFLLLLSLSTSSQLSSLSCSSPMRFPAAAGRPGVAAGRPGVAAPPPVATKLLFF